MIQKRVILASTLIAVGVIGLLLMWGLPSRSYSMDRASNIAERYLGSLNNPDLAVGEIMEFERNFYVVYYERSTGIGAFEMLIDKATGRIFPEYGPNMMWNAKYGHGGMMAGGPGGMMGGMIPPPSGGMSIDEDEAVRAAQGFLDGAYPGTVAEDPHPFYGYYTLHVTRDGGIEGMLSVNGHDGAVWLHSWHGAYVQSREMH
ncbi:MAG: hypothetical protein ACE5OO_01180 [Candidatus Bathyarchaeia archaeon]